MSRREGTAVRGHQPLSVATCVLGSESECGSMMRLAAAIEDMVFNTQCYQSNSHAPPALLRCGADLVEADSLCTVVEVVCPELKQLQLCQHL